MLYPNKTGKILWRKKMTIYFIFPSNLCIFGRRLNLLDPPSNYVIPRKMLNGHCSKEDCEYEAFFSHTCISSKSLRAFFLISNRGGTSSILNLFKSANKD